MNTATVLDRWIGALNLSAEKLSAGMESLALAGDDDVEQIIRLACISLARSIYLPRFWIAMVKYSSFNLRRMSTIY